MNQFISQFINKVLNSGVFILIVLTVLIPERSEAWFHRRRHYAPVPIFVAPPNWHRGYWYRGLYGNRVGWWWLVTMPSGRVQWHYYAAPVYPYPPADVPPAYYVEVNGAPPPPAALPPSAPPVSTPPDAGPKSATPPGVAPIPLTELPNNTKDAPEPAKARKQAFTYYCEKPKGYYPSLKDCPAGWIATPVKGPK